MRLKQYSQQVILLIFMNKGESLMTNQVKSEVQIPLKTDLKINLDINLILL